MPDGSPEADLRVAIDDWKMRHHLADDDPVLLVAELFALHLKHGPKPAAGLPAQSGGTDRTGNLPAPAATTVMHTDSVPGLTAAPADAARHGGIGRRAAALALLLAAAGGYLFGKAWP